MVDEPEADLTEPFENRRMFNLLVSGVAGTWEGAHLDMDLDRFNTYSGKFGEIVDADDPASLRQLNGAPALVMYELGVQGPNCDVVRHGRLRNVARYGKVVSCQIELDEERPYLPRDKIVDFQRHLDMDRFEQGRTHWAIKDGELPPALLDAAFKALPTPETDPTQKTAATPETFIDDVAVLAEGARVVVVIVGLEAYRPGPNEIEAVAFAQADAKAFQQAVETAFATHRPEICLLTNEGATYGDLINEIAGRAYEPSEFVDIVAGPPVTSEMMRIRGADLARYVRAAGRFWGRVDTLPMATLEVPV